MDTSVQNRKRKSLHRDQTLAPAGQDAHHRRMSENESMDLDGKILIAMPGMGDPRFEGSVILVCTHTDEGSMGLIVNKSAGKVSFGDLLKQLGIENTAAPHSPPICFGGPVDNSRGFVLHSTDYDKSEATMDVPGGFGMTATIDILHDIAIGEGPERALLALGYSGWGPGQLEDEILDNGWLIGDASMDLIFAAKNPEKWGKALSALGIDAIALSATSGRA